MTAAALSFPPDLFNRKCFCYILPRLLLLFPILSRKEFLVARVLPVLCQFFLHPDRTVGLNTHHDSLGIQQGQKNNLNPYTRFSKSATATYHLYNLSPGVTGHPAAKLHSSSRFQAHRYIVLTSVHSSRSLFIITCLGFGEPLIACGGVLDTFLNCTDSKAKKRFPIVRFTVSIGCMHFDI